MHYSKYCTTVLNILKHRKGLHARELQFMQFGDLISIACVVYRNFSVSFLQIYMCEGEMIGVEGSIDISPKVFS